METGRVVGITGRLVGVAGRLGVTTVRLAASRGSLCVTPAVVVDGCRFRSVLRALVGLGREPVEVRLIGDSGTVGAGGEDTISAGGADIVFPGVGLGDRALLILL
eukprot:sb/3477986/